MTKEKKNQDFLGSERKHKELLEKIEQTNLLRESNITLRSQLEESQGRITTINLKLKQTEIEIEPLKQLVSQLETEVEARKSEGKALLEDNSRWKGRAQQILEKYERIDPLEHENLKTMTTSLKEESLKLTEELTILRSSYESIIAEKENLSASFQSEIAKLRAQHDAALIEKENAGVNEEIASLKEKLASVSDKKKSIAKQANEKLMARKAQVDGLEAKIITLEKELAAKESQLAKSIQDTQMQVSAKEAEIARVNSLWESKYSSLEQQKSALKAQPSSIPVVEVLDEKTPSKRGREIETSSAPEVSKSPSTKRIRIENEIEDVSVEITQELPTEPDDLVEDEESADLIQEGEAQEELIEGEDFLDEGEDNPDVGNAVFDQIDPATPNEEAEEDVDLVADASITVDYIPDEDGEIVDHVTPATVIESADISDDLVFADTPEAMHVEQDHDEEAVIPELAAQVEEKPQSPVIETAQKTTYNQAVTVNPKVETDTAVVADTKAIVPPHVVFSPKVEVIIKAPEPQELPAKVSILRPTAPIIAAIPAPPSTTVVSKASNDLQGAEERKWKDALLKAKMAALRKPEPIQQASSSKPKLVRPNPIIPSGIPGAAAARIAARGGLVSRGRGRGGMGRGQTPPGPS